MRDQARRRNRAYLVRFGAFSAAQPNSLVRFRSFGYLKLVLGDPHYSWQFVDESGNVLDSGTTTCH